MSLPPTDEQYRRAAARKLDGRVHRRSPEPEPVERLPGGYGAYVHVWVWVNDCEVPHE